MKGWTRLKHRWKIRPLKKRANALLGITKCHRSQTFFPPWFTPQHTITVLVTEPQSQHCTALHCRRKQGVRNAPVPVQGIHRLKVVPMVGFVHEPLAEQPPDGVVHVRRASRRRHVPVASRRPAFLGSLARVTFTQVVCTERSAKARRLRSQIRLGRASRTLSTPHSNSASERMSWEVRAVRSPCRARAAAPPHRSDRRSGRRRRGKVGAQGRPLRSRVRSTSARGSQPLPTTCV